MRKLFVLLSLTLLANSTTYANTHIPEKAISIVIDNKKIETDVAPEMKRGTTFVPISFIAKELNATVTWKSPIIEIVKDDVKLIFEIGKLNVLRNDEKYILEEAPYILEGRTMVPLRVISEQFGCAIHYDNVNKRIDIYTKDISPFKPPVDTYRYELSPDHKWGLKIKTDFVPYKNNSQITINSLYLKNMETQDMIEIFNGTGLIWQWLDNHQLFIASQSGNLKDKSEAHFSTLRQIAIYHTDTNQLDIIAKDTLSCRMIVDKGIIGYAHQDKSGKTHYYYYDFNTNQTQEVTEATYNLLYGCY